MTDGGAEPVIAIDGPAASGKSTVALALARRLGLLLVDSGSMYRAVAFLAAQSGIPVEDEDALSGIAGAVRAEYRAELPVDGPPRVLLGDRDITEEIRSAAATGAVSAVSVAPAVREEIVRLQRSLASKSGAVVEGRDIGTTVFPDADLKVFLEASLDERSRRRYQEYLDKHMDVTLPEVARQISRRDEMDSSRESSPLAVAPGALIIDTTEMTVSRVVDKIIGALTGDNCRC